MPNREPRGTYTGPAELWAGDSKVADVMVSLSGYVQVAHIKTIDREADKDNTVSWDGVLLDGLSQAEQTGLFGQHVELRLGNGKVGSAVFAGNDGSISGLRWPPFSIVYNGIEVAEESEIHP